jgi:hypothetical protein
MMPLFVMNRTKLMGKSHESTQLYLQSNIVAFCIRRGVGLTWNCKSANATGGWSSGISE